MQETAYCNRQDSLEERERKNYNANIKTLKESQPQSSVQTVDIKHSYKWGDPNTLSFTLIHGDFKPLNRTSNIHLIQTVPHLCVWSHGPRVRGHCQTAVCLHFPILLRPQAGVVHRRVLKSGCTLS